MAIKMVEGSLFAVLLRSPWWYSALIALALVFISLVVGSSQIAVFFIALALPFLGIAGFAFFKQSQRPSQKRVVEVASEARNMSAGEIAAKISESYTELRFLSEPFKGKEADLELVRGNRTLLLNSKRFKASTTGIEQLKKLVAAGEKAEATGYLYVTLGEISANARSYAKENNIELIQADRLAEFFDGKAKIQ